MSNTVHQDWLNLLCQMLPNVRAAVFSSVRQDPEQAPIVHAWPPGSEAEPDLLASVSMADQRRASVTSSSQTGAAAEQELVVACPLLFEGRRLGTVGVRASVPPAQQNSVLQLLQWGGAWLQLLQSGPAHSGIGAAPMPTEELLPLLQCADAELAAITAAGLLARKLGCERVAVGLADDSQVTVLGLSDRATYDPKTSLSLQIRAVIEETLVAGQDIGCGDERDSIGRELAAHASLTQSSGHYIQCCLLRSGERVVGAVVLEFREPPSSEKLETCRSLAPWLGAMLDIRRRQDHTEARFASRLRGVFTGRGRSVAYAAVLGLLAVLLFAGSTTTDKVVADAALEGAVQRAIVSPFDSYVAASHHRAGETVAEGDLLASLKDDDLKLERQKWRSESAELQREYRKALATLDHSRARIVQSQVEQAEAELALLDYQLQQVELRAPFDGVIIEGDLSQQLGVPVDRGELLFRVAPLDEYRVVLQVDQRDVTRIQAGQQGALALAALPGTPLRFRVSQVSGVAVAERGLNSFRVEAELLDTAALDSLRPGLQGIGKVEVGDTRRIAGWTRRLWGWLKLQAWKWLP